MKKVLFIATLAITLSANALNYTISFTGSGASTTIDQVVVQNLTKSTSVIVPAGNVLNLTDVTTYVQQTQNSNEGVLITQQAQNISISFNASQTGETQLSVYGIDGRKVVGLSQNLEAGSHSFLLSLPKGIYVIKVSGNDFNYTAKAISQSIDNAIAQISYVGSDKVIVNNHPQKSKSSGVTNLSFKAGDLLLYTATSGNYSTIVTDVPTGDKTTDFGFVACTDADGNNYSVVTIGTQTWMAENLRTSKYRNGDGISNLTLAANWNDDTFGAWSDFNNDAANDSKYGKLYNWYAVNETRNIAPLGWHVASITEWISLSNYESIHYGVSLSAGSALASTSFIITDHSVNNYSGFSALPGGIRYTNGTFSSKGVLGLWWSSTVNNLQAYSRGLGYNTSNISIGGDSSPKGYGHSVRCIKD